MPFGSFLAKVGRATVGNAEGRTFVINKNPLEKLVISLFGIPQIAIRTRAVLIFRYLKPKKDDLVLDGGCGFGFYALTYALKGHKVIGVDIEDDRVKQATQFAKKLGVNATFETADLCSLSFKDNIFDKILSSDVLEHIKNDKRAFSELARVLKPGGTMIITVPADNALMASVREQMGHERPGYSVTAMKKMAVENGLTLRKVGETCIFFGKAAWKVNHLFIWSKILTILLFYPLFWLSYIDHVIGIVFPRKLEPVNYVFTLVKNKT